jgi:thiamine-monophosphate kinase
MTKLSDIGERKLLSRVQRAFQEFNSALIVGIGDDAAVLKPFMDSPKSIVVTTDPSPLPAAWSIFPKSFYDFGWLTIIINVSDLASMGAVPIGITLAFEAPETMSLKDFNDYLRGARDAAIETKCPVIGGNLKDGAIFSSVGTAIGICDPTKVLRRSGARDGDNILVIGQLGFFWASFLAKYKHIKIPKAAFNQISLNLRKPLPKHLEGNILSTEELANSCMDNSDGLLPCCYEIARQSEVDFYLDFSEFNIHPVVLRVAKEIGVNPMNLCVGWGDWQLVTTVPDSNLSRFQKIFDSKGYEYHIIGKVKKGKGDVYGRLGTEYKPLRDIDSERFTNISQFSHGIDAYIDNLLSPLFL